MKKPKAAANAAEKLNTAEKNTFGFGYKAKLISICVFAGLLIIGLVIASAYVADVKFEINQTIKENNTLRGEIENLNVKIKSASSISTVEQRASNELGMVYPAADQYVYIGRETGAEGGVAMMIIDNAYN